MATVYLGNPAALDDGEPMEGQRITTATIPEDHTVAEALSAITARDGVWPNHSAAPAPAWVESDNEDLACLLSSHYGCRIGRPSNWGASDEG